MGLIAAIWLGLIAAAASDTTPPAPGRTYVLTGVNVIPMDSERVLRDRTVVVSDGRIVAMSQEGVEIPRGAAVIEGADRYLIPGLADMHVHIGGVPQGAPVSTKTAARSQAIRDELLLFVANGVTTVRNMSGSPLHLQLARDVESGAVAGPRIVNASPIIDGSPPAWATAIPVTQPAHARQLVHELAAAGYDFIKVYHNLTPDVYSAIVEEARRAKIPVVGHVPFGVGLTGALASRQYSIEHLRGYDIVPGVAKPSTLVGRFSGFLSVTEAFIEQSVSETVAAGTWNCPTLALQVDGAVSAEGRRRLLERPEMQLLPPSLRQSMVDDRFYVSMPPEVLDAIAKSVLIEFRILRRLAAQGAPLIAGTDSPLLLTVPGFALHRELEVMTRAGLRPFEVLRAATADAARFLGRDATSGAIAPGMRADLVLLDGDPLADITQTRQIAGVMAQGRWFDRATLDGILNDLESRNGQAAQESQAPAKALDTESGYRETNPQ